MQRSMQSPMGFKTYAIIPGGKGFEPEKLADNISEIYGNQEKIPLRFFGPSTLSRTVSDTLGVIHDRSIL